MTTPQGGAVRKGLPVWLWILIGLFGLIVVAVATVTVGAYYFIHQFTQNPRAMVQKFVEHNPNIEIVSDDGAGHITLKDRRNGKNFTVDYDEAKKGHIRIEGDRGEKVTVKADERGVEVTDNHSSAKIGPGAARIPAWVPAYPASSPQAAVSAIDNGEEEGGFHFTTGDDAQKVAKHYEDALKRAGFTVTTEPGSTINAEDAAHRRSLRITIGSGFGHTAVAVHYGERR